MLACGSSESGPITTDGGAGAGGQGMDGVGGAASSTGGQGTGGQGTGGGGGGATSTGGQGGAGGSGTGGGSTGGTGASSSGGTLPGDGGTTDDDGGTPCTSGTRRCVAEQPQQCTAGEWADDGDGCSLVEPCNGDTGTCEVSSITVPGGTFYRSYDVDETTYVDQSAPATVSTLRLDTYEVTVGQMRPFLEAVLAGWRPPAASGKHSHLNAGSGLANSGPAGGHEGGWDAAWDDELPEDEAAWNDAQNCAVGTWTPEPSGNELRPINCVTWYEAYAYCIWSGGFLPSEAERNYAASGGDEHRMYPWGSAAPSATLVVYNTSAPADVGQRPAGSGRWGHADLAGNVDEWALDWHIDPYATPCADCAHLEADTLPNRILRGGNFDAIGHGTLRTGHRGYGAPGLRFSGIGIRCARAPD
jgi:formylglycine-generating enzyme